MTGQTERRCLDCGQGIPATAGSATKRCRPCAATAAAAQRAAYMREYRARGERAGTIDCRECGAQFTRDRNAKTCPGCRELPAGRVA